MVSKIMFLLILDSLGNTELLLILLAALIFFGPRKLPQLSRQLGRSLSEFRRASDDFKRTWEREANLDNIEKGFDPQAEHSVFDRASERIRAAREAAASELNPDEGKPSVSAPSVTPADPALVEPRNAASQTETETTEQPKHEWL